MGLPRTFRFFGPTVIDGSGMAPGSWYDQVRAISMTLTIDLPEEETTLLQAKASAEGLSAEQCARQLIQQALASSGARRPLATRIRDLWADLPDDVRVKLLADGASQHDHYIYGVPKRTQ
jgi:plasmid stability protein